MRIRDQFFPAWPPSLSPVYLYAKVHTMRFLPRSLTASRQTARLRTHRCLRLCLEVLEDRTLPTVFATVAAGDVATLIADINAANNNGQASNTINLSAGTYELTAINNYWYGPDGLPAISSNLTINGNGAVIQRDASAPAFRLFYVSCRAAWTVWRRAI